MKTKYIGAQPVPYVAVAEPSDHAKPCPFCGHKRVFMWRGEIAPFSPYYIECDNCEARTTDHSNSYDHLKAEDHKASAERALQLWNQRVAA